MYISTSILSMMEPLCFINIDIGRYEIVILCLTKIYRYAPILINNPRKSLALSRAALVNVSG